MSQPDVPKHDAYAALRIRDYRLFSLGRNLSGLGDAMQSVAVGWELYLKTGKPLTLGWVGLIQALPIFLFALHAGHIADTYSRKRIAIAAQLSFCVCSVALGVFSVTGAGVPLFYLCLFCAATGRAFGNPARTALLPQVVPLPVLNNAISWDISIRRIAVICGTSLGGWLLGWNLPPVVVYGATAVFGLVSALLLLQIPDSPPTPSRGERVTWKTLSAGIAYIRRTRIILATITLDLFAVLLGGATSLLPVYAKDILHAGPKGLGWMRAASSVGALGMALALAYRPSFRYPGRVMLWAVAGFGVATIVFGLSRSMPLSLTALAIGGAVDMISVVVRQTLVQTLAPDSMRGRINAVNGVFINTSNELGGFESGVVAQITSPTFSVVSGGIGTILVVLAAAAAWPSIRTFDSSDPLPAEEEAAAES